LMMDIGPSWWANTMDNVGLTGKYRNDRRVSEHRGG
jgi:hypothetical protein